MPPLPNNTTPSTKHHENSSSDNKKTTTKLPAPEHGVKCPRCDSPNTKFCYYNNYSLTQPRHFCKTCRRYWTNGGALRNVPIGGGCRKNKKVKTSTFSSSAWDSITKDSSSSAVSSLAGLRFFNNSPSLEFQLGGGLPLFPATRVHHTHHQHQQQEQQSSFSTGYNQFSTIGGLSNVSSLQLDPSGNLNYPFCSSTSGSGINGASVTAMRSTIQGMNSMNVNTSLASSIESLSSINQDLHLKLQQQRLATMYDGDNINININQKEGSSSVSVSESQVQFENANHTLKPQPLLFQNLEISKPEMFQNGNYRKEGSGGDAPVEWFFGNSNYSSVTPASATTTNGLDNGNNNWSGGVHAWSDVQQPYNALP